MDISIIICTYNRSHNITDCIDCLSSQKQMENLRWEIVLVDNNSTDGTDQIVRNIELNLSILLRYFFEPLQGLSYARNRGVKEAAGDYLVFIDDDIRVMPHWLRSIYDTFQACCCDAVGGRIYIDSPKSLPQWIQPAMRATLGYRDFGSRQFIVDRLAEIPFGGNMSFRRDVFDKIGLFDTRMGRRGEGRKRRELFKDEEINLFCRLIEAGGIVYYQPNAIVIHKILPHQLEKMFFRIVHFNSGFQSGLLKEKQYRRSFFGVPLDLFSGVLKALIMYFKVFIIKGPNIAFLHQLRVVSYIGKILGHVRRNGFIATL
jgi:glucosyl-dolichyl phosphate glucuronosyltransferase